MSQLKITGSRTAVLVAATTVLFAAPSVMAGGQADIGPQVRVDPGTGTLGANETTASASDANPNEIIAGWNDFRTDGSIKAGFSISLDGGQTWIGRIVRPPAGQQSGVEGDPMSAFDPRTGTLWAGAISFASNGGLYVAKKNPGDDFFQPSVVADFGGGIDKCWMAAGPRPGQPNTTRLYIAYNFGVVWSDDMGSTWTNPVSLGQGIGFLPRVGPNGELYVAYWDFGTGMMMKRSLNGGASFTTHRIATRMDTWSTQDGSRFPGTFRVPPMVTIDVDENTGDLYAAYFDTTNIQGNGRNVDVYFTKSTDQGATWSTPRVINTDATPPGDQFFSWIEVDSRGRIHIVMNDSRHTPQNDGVTNGMFDNYYMVSTDGGTTWQEHRLNPSSWNSNNDGGVWGSQQFMGDYLGMAVAGDTIWPIYVDNTANSSQIFTNIITFGSIASVDGLRTNDGQEISGGINDVRSSDDSYYISRSMVGSTAQEPNVVEVQMNAVWNGGVDAFDITVEGRIDNPNGLTRLQLFNFDTGDWEEISQFASGMTETVEQVHVANADPYVRDSDGRIRLRLRTVVVVTFAAIGFHTNWDVIEIEVIEP